MYGHDRFVCPHCETGAKHKWYKLFIEVGKLRSEFTSISEMKKKPLGNKWSVSLCTYCQKIAVWIDGNLKFPAANTFGIEEPNIDLPDEIKKIYNEARNVFPHSSRSSAALLRLAMELMLSNLGFKQGKLFEKINALISAEGTSEELVLATEIIRLYGNSSTHAGFIDLNDDKESAVNLFMALNVIADHTYTKKRRLNMLLEKLPESKRDQVKIKMKKATD